MAQNGFHVPTLPELFRSVDGVRILAYTALLWQDLIKSGAIREGEALPPVFPMVIYNGRTPWTAARDVAELLTPVNGPLDV